MFLTRTIDVKNISDILNEENSEFKYLIIIDLSNGIKNESYSEILKHTIKGIGNLDKSNLYAFIDDINISIDIWKMVQLLSNGEENINSSRDKKDILAVANFDAIRQQNGEIYLFFSSDTDSEIMQKLGDIQKHIKKQENIAGIKYLSMKILSNGLPEVWKEIVKLIAG
ncbi:hypothetical protein [Thiothrix nivea]|uniref:Uncharacterized protein n=1 Tax=Thiothrix nivea (strain ATCC 35100 / DSM 5205 / JP2) TaxID=870187 RepID=A0A656HKD9_THINJ|nr:hypothetical protein [Thiothrix nivea]EIJ36947.1 hypothetical protein Thini_4472 [Thiothrix nivea DSM 5205]